MRDLVETELVLATGQLHYCDTLSDPSKPFTGREGKYIEFYPPIFCILV